MFGAVGKLEQVEIAAGLVEGGRHDKVIIGRTLECHALAIVVSGAQA